MDRPLLVAILGLFALSDLAWTQAPGKPVGPPEDLPAAVQQQTAARAALTAQASAAKTTLAKWYEGALDTVKRSAQAKGDLDTVLAIDAERGRAERDLTAEEKGQLPAALRTVRSQYDQARQQQASAQKASLAASLRAYASVLEGLEKRLTQKGDFESAVAARKERASATAEAAPLIAVAPATPAAPPGTPPSRPPVVSSIGSGTASVLNVASLLATSKDVQGAGKDTVPFTGLTSFKRTRTSRGVLLMNAGDNGHHGSTWHFTWSFNNPAAMVYMVHPYENGHVIVKLSPTRLEPVAYKGWQEAPTGAGGSDKYLHESPAAAELFPLKQNEKYDIVGSLTSKGVYTLAINGKVVIKGDYKEPILASVYSTKTPIVTPPSLEGENLPKKWKPGYAAMIVSVFTEASESVCEEMTYRASVP